MRDHVDVLLGWVARCLIFGACILGAGATLVVFLRATGALK